MNDHARSPLYRAGRRGRPPRGGSPARAAADEDLLTDNVVAINETVSDAGFVHPGVGLSADDLRNAQEMVRTGQEPWASYFDAMTKTGAASTTYRASNSKSAAEPDVALDPNFNHGSLRGRETNDSFGALTQSLMWVMTGDEVYRKNAIQALRTWASMNPDGFVYFADAHIHTGKPLSQFLMAAEIIRATEPVADDTPGTQDGYDVVWSAEDDERLLANFANPIVDTFLYSNERWMNQHNFGLYGRIATAIYADDAEGYATGVEWFTVNSSFDDYINGSIAQQMPLIEADDPANPYGEDFVQVREMGRDQAHAECNIDNFAAMARFLNVQGTKVDPEDGTVSTADDAVSAYGFLGNRLLAGANAFDGFMMGQPTRSTSTTAAPAAPSRRPTAAGCSTRSTSCTTSTSTSKASTSRPRPRTSPSSTSAWTAPSTTTAPASTTSGPRGQEHRVLGGVPARARRHRADPGRGHHTHLRPLRHPARRRHRDRHRGRPHLRPRHRRRGRHDQRRQPRDVPRRQQDGRARAHRRPRRPGGARQGGARSPQRARREPDVMARIELPDTQGEWRYVTYPAGGPNTQFYRVTGDGTTVDMDSVMFNAQNQLTPPAFEQARGRYYLWPNATSTFELGATDTGGAPAYTAFGLPEGAQLDAATGTITWKPTPHDRGVHEVQIVADDGEAVAARTFELVVAKNRPKMIDAAVADGTEEGAVYTTASYEPYEAALGAARDASENGTDEEFRTAFQALLDAIEALELLNPRLADGSLDYRNAVTPRT